MITKYASAFITITVESEVHQINISPSASLISCDADGENPQFDRLEFTVTAKIGERYVLPFINNNKLQEPFAVSGVLFYISEINEDKEIPSVVLKIKDLDSAKIAYLCSIPVFYKASDTIKTLLGTTTLVLNKYFSGADYSLIELTNQTIQVLCDNSGIPKPGELGENSLNVCNASVFYQAIPLVFTKNTNPSDTEVYLKLKGINCDADYIIEPNSSKVATIFINDIYADKAQISLEFITYGNINDPENALNYKRTISVQKIKDAQKPNKNITLYTESPYPSSGPTTPNYSNLNQPLPLGWFDVLIKPTLPTNAIWSSTAEFSGETNNIITSWSTPIAIILPEPKNVTCSYFSEYSNLKTYYIREDFRTIVHLVDPGNNKKVYYQSKLYGELDPSLRNKDTGKLIFPFTVPKNLSGGNYIEISNIPPTDQRYWKQFQATFESIATGILFAETAYIGNLSSAGIIIGDPESSAGWILDESSIKSRTLKEGKPLTELRSDGKLFAEEATISGEINATSGNFTGAVIVGDAGIDGTKDNPIRFYAGSTFIDKNTAPYRVTDEGIVYVSDLNLTGVITGNNFEINNEYAEFEEIRTKRIKILDGDILTGKVGKWEITEAGLSSGIASNSSTVNSTIKNSNLPTIMTGSAINHSSTNPRIAATVTFNNIILPTAHNTYNVQLPTYIFNAKNDLGKTGNKYSAFYFYIELSYTHEGKTYTHQSPYKLITGQDRDSANTPFELILPGILVKDVVKGRTISNITYSVKYSQTYLSGNSSGSSSGAIRDLSYKINTQPLALGSVLPIIFYPIAKTATLNPDKWEVKKSDTERFAIEYKTINGVEKLVTTITGDLVVSGDVSASITSAVYAERAGIAETALIADSATNALSLNNRTDYYHTENSNNYSTDWTAKIFYSGEGLIRNLYGKDAGSSNERGPLFIQYLSDFNTLINVDGRGMCGVGTNNPTEKLHVIGNVRASGDFLGRGISLSGDASLSNLIATNKIKGANGEFTTLRVFTTGLFDQEVITPGIFHRTAIVGGPWNTCSGALTVDITNNKNQTPLILAQRDVTGDRLYAVELLNSGDTVVHKQNNKSTLTLKDGDKIGINNLNPTEALDIVGNVKVSEKITSKNGQFDNLKVLGNLDVFELSANQTRVTNGDLWIQNSCKFVRFDSIASISDSGADIWIDTPVLKLDDLCIVQVRRPSGSVVRYTCKVIYVNPVDNKLLSIQTITGDIRALSEGDLIVQVGNITNTARQSSILNCVSFGGYGAATLYYAGVNDIPVGSFYPDNSKITSALGDLRSLGYGSASLSTSNGYFEGTVEAYAGKIGNFFIEENNIQAKNIVLSNDKLPTLTELKQIASIDPNPVTDQTIGDATKPELVIKRNISVIQSSLFISDIKQSDTGRAAAASYGIYSGSESGSFWEIRTYTIYKIDTRTLKKAVIYRVDEIPVISGTDLGLPSVSILLEKGMYEVELHVQFNSPNATSYVVAELAPYELRPTLNYLGNNGMMSYHGQTNYLHFLADGPMIIRKGAYLFKISEEQGLQKGVNNDPHNIDNIVWSNI